MKRINIIPYNDPKESGKKFVYQISEFLIYFVWPISVFYILWFFSFSFWISVFVGVFIFMLPVLKWFCVVLTAKFSKLKNPRAIIRSSSFWYDGFLFVGSPALKEIRLYSALSRSLDVIYNLFGDFGVKPEYFPDDGWSNLTGIFFVDRAIKRWTEYWVGMPVAQDVRTRLRIIARECTQEIFLLSSQKKVIKILEVAGGQLQSTIMGIAQARESGCKFDYKVVSIEPDEEFSKERALKLIEYFGLDKNNFHFISSRISTKENSEKNLKNILINNGYSLKDFDLVICIGLGDYYYTPKRIKLFLSQFGDAEKIITANISNNFIERPFLHFLIQWPKMKYRTIKEWVQALSVFEGRKIKILKTTHGIFYIAIIEK